MRGHGSYLRKTPVVFMIRRWRCAEFRITVSMLQDFAAAGCPGGLQQIEDGLMARVRERQNHSLEFNPKEPEG